jgi:cardiolipin synthase
VKYLKLLFLLFPFILLRDTQVSLPSLKEPLVLYSNQIRKDIKQTLIKSIKGAKKSIYLAIFAITDETLIDLLNQKAHEEKEITVVLDAKSKISVRKFHPKITIIQKKEKGLMHQKILVIDEELIFIGSSNFTPSSLRMHDNLVTGIYSKDPRFRKLIDPLYESSPIELDQQRMSLYHLPEDKEALCELLHILNQAQKEIKVAMFTLSHPKLTQALISAHKRGVKVEVILDFQASKGASKKAKTALLSEGIEVKANLGMQLMHHKCALIDQAILINGSTNWTQGAFTKNRDLFFVLSPLNVAQKKRFNQLWKNLKVESQRLH